MFHISTLVCDVLRTSVCVAEMWRHVLVRAVAVVEHLEIQHSCATSFPLREGTRRVGGGRCWKNMPEAVIVSIVNVMRHQPLLCCCKVTDNKVCFMGCPSGDYQQPDSHNEAKAGRSWGSTSTCCTWLLASPYLARAARR